MLISKSYRYQKQKILISILILVAAIYYSFLSVVNFNVLASEEATVEISQDSSASVIGSSVQAGSGASDFNITKIQNKSNLPIVLNWVKYTRSGGSDDDFSSVSLYVVNSSGSRSQIGSTQYLFSSGVVYFDTFLTIPANSSVVLALSATVPSSAKAGDVVTWNLVSNESVSVSVSGSVAYQPIVSGSSNGVSRTILGSGPDTTPPAAPSNITVVPVGTEPTLRISWTDPADKDLEKIIIYRSTVKDQLGAAIKTLSRGSGYPLVTYIDDRDIAVDTTYYYTLKAADLMNNESTASSQVSGIVYKKGLNILLDSSSPAQTQVNASTSDVTLGVFKFAASNTDAIISNLKFAGLSLDQISKLYLYVDNNLVASTTSAEFVFYNDGSQLSVPMNTSKILTLKGDVPASAYSGEITLYPASLIAKNSIGASITIYGLETAANKITINGATPPLAPSNQNSSSANHEPLNNSLSDNLTAGIPEGALIRAIGDIDVYIVKYVGNKKFKRLILSPSVFNNYGHLKWSDIRDVDPAVVNAFTTSELVRAVGDPKVYKLYPAGDIGEKRWIKTAEAFLRMGFDWDAIYEINSFDRDSYITGSDLE